MENLKRDEIILMYSLTKAADLYHICEVPWAHTQEIIVKNNSREI